MWQDFAKKVESWVTIPGIPVWASVCGLSILMAVVSLIITAIALVAIPPDYFVGPEVPDWTRHRHPILRWTFRLFRNGLGWVLILLGIVLSIPPMPGQGLLTILLGLMLVEFPRKRRVEQWFVRKPRIHRAVNAIRTRFGAQSLVLDGDESKGKN